VFRRRRPAGGLKYTRISAATNGRGAATIGVTS